MTSSSDIYVDLENINNNSCKKECKLRLCECVKDLANLLIPIFIVFGLISLIIFIIINL